MARGRILCILSVLSQVLLIASLTLFWLQLLVRALLHAAEPNPVSLWSKRPGRNHETGFEGYVSGRRTTIESVVVALRLFVCALLVVK